MARATTNYKIDSATARLALDAREGKANKPFWHALTSDTTLAVGYQKPVNGAFGRWFARKFTGGKNYLVKGIGIADDAGAPANAITFKEAVALVPGAFDGHRVAADGARGPVKVAAACTAYVTASASRYKTEMNRMIARHVTPFLGEFAVVALKKSTLESWRADLVERLISDKTKAILNGRAQPDADDEIERKARDTANRIIAVLKAALNHACSDRDNKIENDSAWRLGLVKFENVGRARSHHFDEAQVSRLISTAPDRNFGNLMAGGWFTGARYGELCVVRVKHFDAARGELVIPSGKTGHRVVHVVGEAITFLANLCTGRGGEEFLFTQGNGRPFGSNFQSRPMKTALAAAGLDQGATFYALRHSYISRAIEAGVPLTLIADNCGTSLRMIEENYAHVLGRARRAHFEKFAPRVTVPANDAAMPLPLPLAA